MFRWDGIHAVVEIINATSIVAVAPAKISAAVAKTAKAVAHRDVCRGRKVLSRRRREHGHWRVAGGRAGQWKFLHDAVVVEGHDARLLVNLHDLDVVLPLAFGKDVGLVAGFSRRGLAGDFEQHLQVSEDGHDAVGRDFGGRLGGCRRFNRRRVQTKNIPRDDGRVGIVRRYGIVREQTGVERQPAREAECRFHEMFHAVNIPRTDKETNTANEF